MLTVATFNIRNTTDRYEERKPLLHDVFRGLILVDGCDVFGLQEVRFQTEDIAGVGVLSDQTEELITSKYVNVSVYRTDLTIPATKPGVDESFRIDGNCIVTNNDTILVLSHSSCVLSPFRNAQRVVFKRKDVGSEDRIISFTNIHYHHEIGPEHELTRLDQATQTCEWISRLDQEDGVSVSILAGDFNATPSEPAYAYITTKAGYWSCFPICNGGSEPEKTFATGLIAPTMDTDPPLTCDYVFVKQLLGTESPIAAVRSTLVGNKGDADDNTLYPSDHFGIQAVLKW
jgi:endonuclease/exonuclease/phosphatase family metal-dependent hydrolase